MANYASQAQLESQFGQREIQTSSDRDSRGEIDEDVVTKALTDATEEINSYLANQYDLPLATVPGRLVTICCDIALYKMSADAGTGTDEKRLRYEDAVAWLKMLAKGDVSLGLPPDDVDSAQDAEVSSSSEVRIFSRTTMGGLI